MGYILAHTRLGFCIWDIVAAVILIAVIAMYVTKSRKLREEREDLEDQISQLYAEDSLSDAEDPAAK